MVSAMPCVIPWLMGYRDVQSEATEGAVHEEGAIAFLKVTPFCAILSMLGVVLRA